MSAATLIFGPDSSAPRQTLAFSLSLLLHLTLAFAVLLSIRCEMPPAPLEISIFEGPGGPASPPPGESRAEPGPVGPTADEVRPIVATEPRATPRAKVAARARSIPKPWAAARSVEGRALLVASKEPDAAPTVRPSETAQSSVPQQAAVPGSARSEADAALGSAAGTAPEPSGNPASGVALRLPGPGGGGSGWSSGSGDAGEGAGGTGRGGFSVSGAGAGGAGRTHASIWAWTQRYLAGLRSAYNDELFKEATLRGVIVVRYEILGSGAVGQVTLVSSQLRDPGFERALLKQIRGWRYPPEQTGTVVVTWPFSFRPPS